MATTERYRNQTPYFNRSTDPYGEQVHPHSDTAKTQNVAKTTFIKQQQQPKTTLSPRLITCIIAQQFPLNIF